MHESRTHEFQTHESHAMSPVPQRPTNPGFLLAACLALVLAACASVPPQPPAVDDPVLRATFEAAQQDREQRLRADADWSLAGRIAASNAGRGGSGRIEWQQDGTGFEVSISAPVTRQSWRLEGGRGHAVLEGAEGGARHGTDARLLLLEATGWDVPVHAFPAWMRGLRAEQLGPAAIDYGVDGLPLYIEQDGWRIEYLWPATDGVQEALPRRMEATRGEARVRLVADAWSGVGE